jgi:hypothetical protein
MGINPVVAIGSAVEAQSGNAGDSRRSEASLYSFPPPRTATAGAESGTSPKQESAQTQSSVSAAAEPQDEVQVQRDSQTDGEIVIRYLNSSGQVILQVPSSQVIEFQRAIAQNLQQASSARTGASDTAQTDEGGKSNGG